MLDLTKLEEKLGNLRGLEFETAEMMTRRNSSYSVSVEVSMLKEFQARLAAFALEVPYEDIRDLPIKQYAAVCARVVNFLYLPSGEETASESSEA